MMIKIDWNGCVRRALRPDQVTAEPVVWSPDDGGHRSITPPSSSQLMATTERAGRPERLAGEDTVYLDLRVAVCDPDRFTEFLDNLRKHKELAKQGQGTSVFPMASTAFEVFDVSPRAGIRYRYLVQFAGVLLYLNDSPPKDDQQQNARLRLGSMILAKFYDSERAKIWIETLFREIGLGILWIRQSETHVFFDLLNVPVREVVGKMLDGCMVCRVVKSDQDNVVDTVAAGDGPEGGRVRVHRRWWKLTGITAGSRSSIELCVYDKKQELKQTGDFTKETFLREYCWQGNPQEVTRIEFRISRERLKTFGVDQFHDWLRERDRICDYLVTKWLRLTERRVKSDRNKHQSRAKTWAVWDRVREGILAVWQNCTRCFTLFNDPLPAQVSEPATLHDARPQLLKQAFGCLVSCAGLLGPMTPQETVKEFLRSFRQVLKSKGGTLYDHVQAARLRWEAKIPL